MASRRAWPPARSTGAVKLPLSPHRTALSELAANRPADALAHLDRGAEQFGDHLGSWLASGWAYFLAGDVATARARFEKALELDDTFGEGHGSLAALDAMAGDLEAARRRMEIARRLDNQSFSAALAGIVIAEAEGNPDRARRIFEIASSQPLSHDGKTLAQLLTRAAL
ncbi:tetratricopeptide repeat protein [Erythrobacter sp. JK5]|uniref:tetratricopeptide repeat protein n=1 Tax=Erythrobacter sp. JK5 TaxID=2829500 RepID=UPI001BA644F8|nr:tetratricopeptide repeat protein [Erythrobacter sp. JK5]QUL37951.1 tetratricopeptide repeat protein [Erythrobacter sp. JK5]